MAQIALVALANAAVPAATYGAVAATAAGVAAAAAGAYIDATLVFPALFGTPQVTGPRLNDLQLQLSAEGADIPWFLGKLGRVPTVPIWASAIRETSFSSNRSSKAGPDVTKFEYRLDLALAVSDVGITEQEVTVSRLFGDGQVIYKADPITTYNNNTYSFDAYTTQIYVSNPGVPVVTYFARITSPPDDEAFDDFITSTDITMSGWATGNNNGTFDVIDSGRNQDGSTWFEITNGQTDPGWADEAAGATVTVTQDTGQFFDSVIAAIDVTNLGSRGTNTVPSVIEGFEGVGEVPSSYGTALVVLEGLNMTKFGNRIPNITAELSTGGFMNMPEAIRTIFRRSGLEETTPKTANSGRLYNARAVLNKEMKGIYQIGVQSPATAISQLLVGSNMLVREEDATLRFLRRDAEATIVVPEVSRYYQERVIPIEDLAAIGIGEETPRPLQVKEISQEDLPKEVSVKFRDIEEGLAQGEEPAPNPASSSAQIAEIDLTTMSMTKKDAREIAYWLLWASLLNRERVTMYLPPNYFDLVAYDLLRVTVFSRTFRLAVQKVDMHAGYCVVEAMYEDKRLYEFVADELSQQQTAAEASRTFNDLTDGQFSPTARLAAFELRDADSAGIILATAVTPSSRAWVPPVMFESRDSRSTYQQVDDVTQPSVMGLTSTELGDGHTMYLDRGNTVDVRLYNGELASVSLDQVHAGQNRALIGREVVGFTTALALGDGSYRLSGLMRGLLHTEEFTSEHDARERFVLLDDSYLVRGAQFSDIGAAIDYKAVPDGRTTGDVLEYAPVVIEAAALKPWAGVDFAGTRDGSNNLTITWNERSRAAFLMFAEAGFPSVEASDSFEVDIYSDGTYTTVVRTIEVTATSAAYTAAEQTTDGLTPGATIYFKAYQLSRNVGRGYPATASV